jgi:hypothetical protein
LEARFVELSVPQQGRFISAVADQSLETALFGLGYEESKAGFSVSAALAESATADYAVANPSYEL